MTEPRDFPATVVRWRDGDTVVLSVDLGFHVNHQVVVRLDGIDAPEKGQRNHDEAAALAEELAPVGSDVTLVSVARDPEKWGRWLGDIHTDDLDVGTELLRRGLADEYHGGTKPVP